MEEIRNLDWVELLDELKTHATSVSGKDVLACLEPLSSAAEAQKSFEIIVEAQNLLSRGERPFAESLDLFNSWYIRLQKQAVLKTLELKDIRHFCLETLALREVLSEQEGEWAKELRSRLMQAGETLSAIDQIITPSGEIRNDASETLYRLYQEKQTLARRIHAILDRLIKDSEMESILQDRYVTNREGRWVLPVKSGMQNEFAGIIHAASHTKQTVFMEPQDIVPANNRLRQIEVDMEEEIERLLTDLSLYLSAQGNLFERSRAALLDADVGFAKAQLSTKLSSQPCIFKSDALSLSNLRHPLLVLRGQKVVANSVELNPTHGVLLLSGPNAGGKTVLLKAVGLAAQMARCGLPICADAGSPIPFFKTILTAIGDEQSVDAQLSTFAAHLKALNQSTLRSGRDNLLLIDEICGSTDPEEGTALARSFIEVFARNQVFAVITSHLGPLKLGWGQDSGVINGSLEYDAQTSRPTYQFLMGVPGQSLAIETAARVGVAEPILSRALSLLSPEAKAHHQAMADLEGVRSEISELKNQLATELEQARKSRLKYQALIESFRREREDLLKRSVVRAERKLNEMLEQAKAADVFRRHEKIQDIRQEFPEIIKGSKNEADRNKISSVDEFAQRFPPGSTVFVPSLNRDGIIQGEPNSKGEVPILSQSMRLFVPWHHLQSAQTVHNPTAKLVRRSASGQGYAVHHAERTIDLRGKTVDEALELLELQLDRAALHNEARVKVIHGHGTNSLKKAIRNYLSRSIYVLSWSAGGQDSSGDGVTWIELKT